MDVVFNADFILTYKCGTDPSHYFRLRLVISSLLSASASEAVVLIEKILLANCSQTDTASNVRSSWKNDTVLYSTRYHPSKPSVRHIPLCTASCVMKSDNTLPRFKSLWLWGDGEAQQEKYVNDVVCVSPWFSTDSISYSAQNSNNCSLTLSSLKC